MAMHDMSDALNTARTQRTPIPPAASNPRSTRPITTAQESRLPHIDISPFLDPTSPLHARTATAQAINAACANYGFFYLTGHGIPADNLDHIIDLARRFFALPLAQKNRIKRFDAGGPEGGDSARGYQGLGENVTGGLQDVQEAVDFYRPWGVEEREGEVRKTLQGPNLWPEEPRELKAVYQGYVERVTEVGRALVRAMGVALELGVGRCGAEEEKEKEKEDEDIFARHCNDSFWVLRMIHYPPLPLPPSTNSSEHPTQFSCGAHTDYGCVTLLLTDQTPGALQVQLKDGTWLPADPLAGAFVVNIGDMIERWTNGLWRSTMHRVVHRGNAGGRISVPFFFEPNFDALVKPLEACVRRSGRSPIHPGSTYGEHLLTKVFSNFYYSKRTDW